MEQKKWRFFRGGASGSGVFFSFLVVEWRFFRGGCFSQWRKYLSLSLSSFIHEFTADM